MENLKEYLQSTSQQVEAFVDTLPTPHLSPREIREGALMYFYRGGKRLRPALLRLFAGAYGGEKKEAAALPAACAAELFHNWTLIHDDIIDHDLKRRGGPSVHAKIADDFGAYPADKAQEYGIDGAILAGDALQAMSVRALGKSTQYGVDPQLTLCLLERMEGQTLDQLICGEALDTRFGVLNTPADTQQVSQVLLGKTGALFAFCASAGTMIGLELSDENDPRVSGAAAFGMDCGLAFQLQDDILGILSDEKTLGKPIGSDVREGKNTLMKLYAYEKATPDQRQILDRAMGNRDCDDALMRSCIQVLQDTGAVAHTQELARQAIDRAQQAILRLPDNRYKELIHQWADSMLNRTH